MIVNAEPILAVVNKMKRQGQTRRKRRCNLYKARPASGGMESQAKAVAWGCYIRQVGVLCCSREV